MIASLSTVPEAWWPLKMTGSHRTNRQCPWRSWPPWNLISVSNLSESSWESSTGGTFLPAYLNLFLDKKWIQGFLWKGHGNKKQMSKTFGKIWENKEIKGGFQSKKITID